MWKVDPFPISKSALVTFPERRTHISRVSSLVDGDDILKYFASTLRISLQDVGNFIFRFGGDEFIIVFPGKSGKEAFNIMNNVIKILRKRPFLSRGRIYKLSFSGGITSYPADGREMEGIINKADKAMYFSKTHGRGKVTLYGQILWKTIEKAAFLVAILLLIAGAIFYFQKINIYFHIYVYN